MLHDQRPPDAESAWPSGFRELDRLTEVIEPAASGSHLPGWEAHYVALEITGDQAPLDACDRLLRALDDRVTEPGPDACNAWVRPSTTATSA